MNALTKKLKSKSGISLVIALVFFLLCAMVGTVVLTAVSVSAGSTARERQLYRETAALTSAADLLSKEIQTMTYTGSYTHTETVTTTVDPSGKISTKVETGVSYERGIPELRGSRLFSVTGNPDGSYSDNLNLTERYFMNQKKLSDGTAVELVPQTVIFDAVENQHIPEVTGSLMVEQDYTLTVVLKCGKNTLTMSFPPQSVPKTNVAEPVITAVTDITTKKITVTTFSTTLTWGKPIMREGGADYA